MQRWRMHEYDIPVRLQFWTIIVHIIVIARIHVLWTDIGCFADGHFKARQEYLV